MLLQQNVIVKKIKSKIEEELKISILKKAALLEKENKKKKKIILLQWIELTFHLIEEKWQKIFLNKKEL